MEYHLNLSTFVVRMIGVEPTCLAAPDPKSGASANFATSAIRETGCKIKDSQANKMKWKAFYYAGTQMINIR